MSKILTPDEWDGIVTDVQFTYFSTSGSMDRDGYAAVDRLRADRAALRGELDEARRLLGQAGAEGRTGMLNASTLTGIRAFLSPAPESKETTR